MKERRRQKRSEKMASQATIAAGDDFDATKPELQLDSPQVKQMVAKAREITKDKETGEDDPVFAMLEKGVKYLPLIQQAIKGFAAAAQMNATQLQPQQEQQQRIQAPRGWEHMSPLQRMAKKYSNPDWYAAGEAYEASVVSGGSYITPINTQQVERGYTPPPSEPRSLAELSKKHPEPPIASDSAPAVEKKEVPEFVKKQQEKGVEVEVEQSEAPKEPTETEQVITAMQQDNAKYIDLALNFLNEMSEADFIAAIKDTKALAEKFSKFKMFLPMQTKEMLKNTSGEELVEIFKQKCSEKYKIIQKQKKRTALLKLFDDLKIELE